MRKIYAGFSLFLLTLPSYAYLDPGSVSIAIQGILAGIAGIAATYKLWFFKVKKIFSFKKKGLLDDEKKPSKK